MQTTRLPAGSGDPAVEPPPPDALPGWRLTAELSAGLFQGGLPICRWRAQPTAQSAAASTIPAAPAVTPTSLPPDTQILIDLTPVTAAILHDREFDLWREAALWRQMYAQDGFADVLAVTAANGWHAVVQHLPGGYRSVLQPAGADGPPGVDGGLGRNLPERLAVPLIRRQVETLAGLLAQSRGLGPAPTFAELLGDLYWLPDANAPRLKWVSPYMALPSTPDQTGRKPAGLLLARLATLILTGRYDDAVLTDNLTAIRPGLTTQLPAWIAGLQRYDGVAPPARLLEQFDAAIAQVQSDVVSAMYRPLG